MHPGIVKNCFSTVSCYEIESEYYILEDLKIQCWNEKHWNYVYLFTIPGFSLWVAFVPSAILYILIKKRKMINNPNFKSRLGFLCNGYKEKFFYWEIVLVYRKIAVAFIAVFMSSGNT